MVNATHLGNVWWGKIFCMVEQGQKYSSEINEVFNIFLLMLHIWERLVRDLLLPVWWDSHPFI